GARVSGSSASPASTRPRPAPAMTNTGIVAKIKKLLALADDQRGKPEGESAARFADRLMREHAISMAEVDGLDLDADPLMEERFDLGRNTWRAYLMWTLARHCNISALRTSPQKPRRRDGTGRRQTGGSMKA